MVVPGVPAADVVEVAVDRVVEVMLVGRLVRRLRRLMKRVEMRVRIRVDRCVAVSGVLRG